MWPLVAIASVVSSVFMLDSPRSLVALAVIAAVAFAMLSAPKERRRRPVGERQRARARAALDRLAFVRHYTHDVDVVEESIGRFFRIYGKALSNPRKYLDDMIMLQESITRDAMAITLAVPFTCRDADILEAVRELQDTMAFCVARVRLRDSRPPDVSPDPVHEGTGAPVF